MIDLAILDARKNGGLDAREPFFAEEGYTSIVGG
jgi:hypothetical protein